MSYRYDLRRDRLTGHDWPGAHGSQFVGYVLDEIEVGARAAMGLDDPEQWWWELHTRNFSDFEVDAPASRARE